MASLIVSAVRSPSRSEYSFLTWLMIASWSSSPPIRSDVEVTIPPSEITATSVVPPPTSTIMLPFGSWIGSPAPIAAAMGSSMMYALDEVAEHLLGHVEVGDHAVLQRSDRLDVRRRAPDHPLGLVADREGRAGERVDRDDRRLVQDDAMPPNVDERVRGPEVDGHILTKEPEDPFAARASATRGCGKTTSNLLGHGGS